MPATSNHSSPANQERITQGTVLCPRCFLPVDPNQHQSGAECELHGRCIHVPCAVKTDGSSCLFCRQDIKSLGRLGVVKLICERMVEATDDLELQLRGQAAMLTVARNGPHEIRMLEECRGISLAMANVNRGHPSLLKHGMELLCIVSQVPYQGLDSQGFTAGCHAVSREVRKIFLLGSSSPQGAGTTDVGGQAQAVDPQLRTLVMSACVALAGLSVSLAITMTDLKLVDVLVKQLQPTGDLQAQVESVAILTALSAHKTVAPRLVAAKVHTAALRLLPMPASELAPPPILTSTAPISPSTHRARKGPKMTYVVSLLADLCEHGAPHEDMEEESALCTRLVKGVLQPMIDDHEVSAQCTRVIVAVAAASDTCAESLGVQGACESLTTLLGRASLPRDTLVNVLDGIYWMCTATDSNNKDRFAEHETAQKVVKGFVSLCSTMRAGADPVLLCCFLRAIRGLATHHRANAEVLGQSAIMHIKELSRTSKDDLDLVSECGAALSALNAAMSTRTSGSGPPDRAHSRSIELDQSTAASEAAASVDGSGGSEDNMSIAEDDEVDDEELVYSRQFKKSSLPSLVRSPSKLGSDHHEVGVEGRRVSPGSFRSSSNAAAAIAKLKSKRLQTLQKLSEAPMTLSPASNTGAGSAYSEAQISRSLPNPGSSSSPVEPPTSARLAGMLQRQPSVSIKSPAKSAGVRSSLPGLDMAGMSSASPSGPMTGRTSTARVTTARTTGR